MRNLIFFVALLAAIPACAEESSVLSAKARGLYSRSSHHYAPCPAEKIVGNPEEARQLSDFVSLIYAAAVTRLEAEMNMPREGPAALAIYQDRMSGIKLELKSYLSKGRLGTPASKTIAALDDQDACLVEWATKSKEPLNRSSAKAVSSSKKLHDAYDSLTKLYSKQPQDIKDSFYDSYCGLDLI